MDILTKIVNERKKDVSHQFSEKELEEVHRQNFHQRTPLPFRNALKVPGRIHFIAEVKKASPSKGIIREDFHPLQIARSYDEAGAECFSVLTEEKHFLGSSEYLTEIKSSLSVPTLRKDFMVHPRQIRESYEAGADAILLLANVLNNKELLELKKLAEEFELDCLAEVHTEEELHRVLDCGFDLVGVNNRNLKTFQTDLSNSLQLIRQFPKDTVAVSESGISNREDTRILYEAGFHAVLVGEALMRKENPGQGISEMRYPRPESKKA